MKPPEKKPMPVYIQKELIGSLEKALERNKKQLEKLKEPHPSYRPLKELVARQEQDLERMRTELHKSEEAVSRKG